MSTVHEIELAIDKLPPGDFWALQDWMEKRASETKGRMWTPAELAAVAQLMVDEPDPARADKLQERWMRGFYGDADA